ncbi:MAG: hypothetical protein SFV22_07170, partial [Saprospiraceae bacterium]|nr:hypothetical protein [Saprospiraceae bacterium]
MALVVSGRKNPGKCLPALQSFFLLLSIQFLLFAFFFKNKGKTSDTIPKVFSTVPPPCMLTANRIVILDFV